MFSPCKPGLQASGNVAGLCNWANAMCTYHEVAKVVEPKILALRESEAELKVAMREKNAAEARMAVVQGKLDEMQVSQQDLLLRIDQWQNGRNDAGQRQLHAVDHMLNL